MEDGKSTNSHGSNMSNSNQTNQTQNSIDAKCGCGLRSPVRFSNTYANPGRRFVGCVNYQEVEEEKKCKFFQWVDPQTCKYGLQYGRHLLKKMKDLEKKDQDLKTCNEVGEIKKEKMMRKIEKLLRNNEALKKKNAALEKENKVLHKCLFVWVIVVGVCVLMWLGNRKPNNVGKLYLP